MEQIMTRHSTRFLGTLAALALVTGCADGPTEPAAHDAELAASLDLMASEARAAGDADAAAAFEGGATSIRAGLTPSEITVFVDGQAKPHKAVVHGVVRGGPGGQQILMRSLLAWSATNPRETMLKVMLLADEAEFGLPPQMVPLGRARGWFGDLVAQARYLATSGSAEIEVAFLGGPCGPAAPDRPEIRCRRARFDVEVDGRFSRVPVTPASESKQIAVDAEGVVGIIVAPPGFGQNP
jgi:hypothetical protein